MQAAMLKLEESAATISDEVLREATICFRKETEQALDALAFDFARDLRDLFAKRGEEIGGRPPTLTVGELVLQIDMASRKAQWFYGKEALTRKLPLSSSAIDKAFGQQQRLILERNTDPGHFLQELYMVWRDELEGRSRRPQGDRLNLVETYGKMILGRQSSRFWNAPSRSTFKDYARPLFVRDLVLAKSEPTVMVNGNSARMRLGVATKSQADSASRSVWLPDGALDGEYYSDLTFEDVPV